MNSIISIVLSGMLIVTGVFSFMTRTSNHRLTLSINELKAKTDSLVRDRDKLEAQIEHLKFRKDLLFKENNELKTKLNTSQSEVGKEDRNFIRLNRDFDKLNERCDNFLSLQKQWDKNKAAIQLTNTRLEAENKDLRMQIAKLSDSNQELISELSIAKLLAKDNISIMRLDKNDNPNVEARRVRKIKISMSLPSEMKSPAFKIFDSKGEILADQKGSFTSHFSKEINPFGNQAARLELTYLLSEKIDPGLYRLEITNDGRHIGNLLMTLK